MPPRVSTTRRGALGGALGLVVLTACDVDDLRPPEDDAGPTQTPSATATPEPDADTVLAEDAAHAIEAAAVAVSAVRTDFPRLRKPLQPLTRMHRAHLEVLEPSGERSVPSPAPAADPADALARIRAVETDLQATLATAAVDARSGALARLLASMSASVSQHLVALEASP